MTGSVADTIVALATPPGRAGVGVVRASGPLCPAIAGQLCPPLADVRRAVVRDFLAADGSPIDRGLVLRFTAPASFTGEDVLELHGHGGPVVTDMLLERLLELGARLARPGEFSQRAFLNDKLDLAQAEAVADLIDAGSRQAARAAMRSLAGAFSQRVHELVEELIELRIYIEAALDFPDEEIDFLADSALGARLDSLSATLESTRAAATQGQVLRDGMTVVIAGPPNVGKSSLLNALAERDSAIVTAIAGTTRDVLRELIQIDGLPVHLIDTAGLRDSDDPVEQEGVRRARQQIADADRVLWLSNAGEPPQRDALLGDLSASAGVDRVENKIDLSGDAPMIEPTAHGKHLRISVKTGAGLDLLRQHLKHCMQFSETGEALFIARRRHLRALDDAAAALARASEQLRDRMAELAAEELRQAQNALNEITGEFGSDDLLGRIFSSFCIGK